MSFSPIEEIIEDIRQGKMVVLVDDEDRENEGDLIMGAQWVRPDDINFMARYGRGLVCLTLTRERCQQLKLPLMVSDTNDKHSTNFTVSIEAAKGVTTGISAADRAQTIRAAVAPDAKPEDLVQPGHIFPIMAQPGGVLSRAGHTEAGCDLARLAGLEPSSAIVEILNEDGTMARRDDLEIFAREHSLKMGTIADLIDYRIRNEKNIERVAECKLPTDFGEFTLYAYRDPLADQLHFGLVFGEIESEKPALVRVHLTCELTDVFSSTRAGLPLPMRKAMELIAKEGSGVAILIRKPTSTNDMIRRIRNYKLQDSGGILPQPEPAGDLRSYGLGAQMLTDLGVQKMRVIGAPKRMHGISGFGLEVIEYVSVDG
ncbi:MAG: bifunctional 3,4-dihydroxy-2-butanone-4-phosphate synthase/GTP cyclohydrolase II [Gammaproteobacteria bacterium]|nr:bifunctional 3,4-dihydroxy-2-butanone-4-phosphate synthase/GTP cyclohydrolase II [Gammaproteobacteria bacterium]